MIVIKKGTTVRVLAVESLPSFVGTITDLKLGTFEETILYKVTSIHHANVSQWYFSNELTHITVSKKDAMTLAHNLYKTNKTMTSKLKSFEYFLSVAYKMLKDDSHFTYVLKGLATVRAAMKSHKGITCQRFSAFIDSYVALRVFAGYDRCKNVEW